MELLLATSSPSPRETDASSMSGLRVSKASPGVIQSRALLIRTVSGDSSPADRLSQLLLFLQEVLIQNLPGVTCTSRAHDLCFPSRIEHRASAVIWRALPLQSRVGGGCVKKHH